MTTNATNTTPHYGLSQWVGEDSILREDFNSDNAIIDAALHAHEQAMVHVRLAEHTVTGDETQFSFDLSGVDLSAYTELMLQITSPTSYNIYSPIIILRLNDNETRGDYGRGHFYHESDSTGNIIGTVEEASRIQLGTVMACGGGSHIQAELCDAESHLLVLPRCRIADFSSGSKTGGVLVDRDKPVIWRNGKLKDVKKMTLSYFNSFTESLNNFPAGTRVLLTGWKY